MQFRTLILIVAGWSRATALEFSRSAVLNRAYNAYFAFVLTELPSNFEKDLYPIRSDLLSQLPRGKKILEVGPGPGANAEWILAAEPSDFFVVEKNPNFASTLRDHYHDTNLKVLSSMSQVPSASIDVVIATLLLCSASEKEILAEIRRVLVKPNGRYFFLEHVRSDNRLYSQAQSVITPLQRALADNCDPSKETENIIRSYFSVSCLTHTTLSGHFPLDPIIAGIAMPSNYHDRIL